ncbi:hypothetical protein JRQ81_008685 [Phrynocephalus forsythii]|uniref:Uncharacterized protein n=1 Tax=Phrynocephalus forsythii TaxID=171643 RepID=A0A9Q0XAP2_9SAUR|nr:hypothetical protein JRQ81_008685 [Phrynocephalus forsythii]
MMGFAGPREDFFPPPPPPRGRQICPVFSFFGVRSRNQELKERIRSLLADLEERTHESKAQEIQQVELTWDFFKAHRALVLAFLNAQKKQTSQQCRLEAQAGHMGQRQAQQLEKLRQALRELEGRREGRGGGPPNGQPS